MLLDPIQSKLLKEVLPEVIDPLLAIINSSLSLGYVPKTFKLAVRLSLSLKKTQLDPKDLVNYRPILNLPFLSKILEKVASSQLYSFLEKNDICEDFQSGFRPSHCTETALIRVTNDLFLSSDRGCISLLVFLDLSATFNTFDHNILLNRFENSVGISGSALAWFKLGLHDILHAIVIRICVLNPDPSESRWWRFAANHRTVFTDEMRMTIAYNKSCSPSSNCTYLTTINS